MLVGNIDYMLDDCNARVMSLLQQTKRRFVDQLLVASSLCPRYRGA
jgi:hypothetical protein